MAESEQHPARSPKAINELLARRAKALANAGSEPDAVGGDALQTLVVRLGEERYALALDSVEEITAPRQVVPLPGTPSFWMGLMNRRGILYPVLDLSAFLGLGPLQRSQSRKIVITRSDDRRIGLAVDEVQEILELERTELSEPLKERSEEANQFTIGISPEMIAVIDSDRLLGSDQLVVDQEVVRR